MCMHEHVRFTIYYQFQGYSWFLSGPGITHTFQYFAVPFTAWSVDCVLNYAMK